MGNTSSDRGTFVLDLLYFTKKYPILPYVAEYSRIPPNTIEYSGYLDVHNFYVDSKISGFVRRKAYQFRIIVWNQQFSRKLIHNVPYKFLVKTAYLTNRIVLYHYCNNRAHLSLEQALSEIIVFWV